MALDIMDKACLRKQMLQHRQHTPPQEKQYIDHQICKHILQSEQYQRSQTIFAYYSTAQEIDTHAIIIHALQDGKCVCLPKCLPGHIMQARMITSQEDLTEESFGIPEPGAHCTVVLPQEIDLCIVPALACDLSGARLGYGGGFYDRFLPQTSAFCMVLCAQDRIFDTLPVQPHDIRCDCIVTEQEVMLLHER